MNPSKFPAPAEHTPSPVRLGVSACLLGQNVRYDGGHKLDRYLIDTMSPFVEWMPVCPEAETGLGIPRDAVWLVGIADHPRLVTSGAHHTDLTGRMQTWAAGRIRELTAAGISGFIFKSRSPSCGMQSVEVRGEDAFPDSIGAGIWARAFMDACPHLPVEDEDRLRDDTLRENFIERLFACHRQRP